MELRNTIVAALMLGAFAVTNAQSGAIQPPQAKTSKSQSLGQVAISQVVSEPPSLRAYLDIRDTGGNPMTGLTVESINAWLDGKPLTVDSMKPFSTTQEGVAYIFLVDVSGSESRPAFEKVKQALSGFVEHLGPADRAAVISFGTDIKDVISYSGDKSKLKAAIEGLKNGAGATHLNAALDEGLRLAQISDKTLPLRRCILILSDGKDEGSGLLTDDVLKRFEDYRVPIYAIGATTLPKSEREQYLEVLHRFAVLSGGAYFDAETAGLDAAYRQIHERINGSWEANLRCPFCSGDGQSRQLQVRVMAHGQELTDKAGITILPSEQPNSAGNERQQKAWPVYAFAGSGLLVFAGVILWFARRGKRAEKTKANAAEEGADSDLTWVPHSFAAPDFNTGPETVDPNGESNSSSYFGTDRRQGIQVEFVRRVNRADAVRTYKGRLVDQLVIGRSSTAAIQIPDMEISGEHCRLEVVNGRVTVSDLGSKNGTSINGVPIQTRQRLEPGDVIALGNVEFRFQTPK